MSLDPGTHIGAYEIVCPLGAGGMGEVYRARDTRLGRDVALKVLPDPFAGDVDRAARFRREAKTLASLNHAHIAHIHGLEEAHERCALVMELVEGQTLAERIARRSLPIDEALAVAGQIADALEYAHERGIVHRDLKPANVKIAPDGTVKVLDFGLAKVLGIEVEGIDTVSPTVTSPMMTAAGVVLGTAPYMSPEQARGESVDKRTDIWAFGAVLFEMLTGRRCFDGGTTTDILASVVRAQPDWSALPPETPAGIRDLLRRTLAKDAKHRLRDMGDARIELEDMMGGRPHTGGPTQAAAPDRDAAGVWSRGRAVRLAAVVSLLAAGVVGGLVWTLRPSAPVAAAPVVRAMLDVGPAEALDAGGSRTDFLTPGGSRTALAWTPDGRTLAFIGRRDLVQQIYVRALDQTTARALPGTDGANQIAVSADGQSVAFWVAGSIKRVPIAGGPVETVVQTGRADIPPKGIAWSAAGLLFAGGSAPISLAVPGHPPRTVTELRTDEVAHTLPQWLPGDAAILYTVRKRMYTWSGEQVIAQPLATGKRTVVVEDATDARYVAGYVVFLRRGVLFAVPFDPVRLEKLGEPVALVSDVAQAITEQDSRDSSGAGQFAVTPAGTLAYVASQLIPMPDRRLVTVDRRGQVTPTTAPVRSYTSTARLSPDGRHVLLIVHQPTERAIWIHDLERPGSLQTLTPGGEVQPGSLWTPDGERVTFGWRNPSGVAEIAWQRTDGSSRPETLPGAGQPAQWTPNGKDLIGLTGGHLWVVASREGGTGRHSLFDSPAIESFPALSPDGRWLAYVSTVSGRQEVYVRPYPGPGPVVPVSVDGATDVAWNPNGRELFFVALPAPSGASRMMSAAIDTSSGMRVGLPRTLFEFRNTDLQFAAGPLAAYSVALDGQRFYVTQRIPTPERPPVTRIELVVNWLEQLKVKRHDAK